MVSRSPCIEVLRNNQNCRATPSPVSSPPRSYQQRGHPKCVRLTGVRAAALAGLAITLPASAVNAGLRILGAEKRLAASTRSPVRDLRKGKAGQRRSGARRSFAGARARPIAPDDFRCASIQTHPKSVMCQLPRSVTCSGSVSIIPESRRSANSIDHLFSVPIAAIWRTSPNRYGRPPQ
jgi:hypothetical protein